MKNLAFAGKLLFITPIAYFGFKHLGNANEMASLVPDFLPMSVIWVFITGMGLVLASVAIIIGKKAQLAAKLLGLMLLIFAVMVHLPSGLSGNEAELTVFFKDIAIAGGAWYMSSHLKDN